MSNKYMEEYKELLDMDYGLAIQKLIRKVVYEHSIKLHGTILCYRCQQLFLLCLLCF